MGFLRRLIDRPKVSHEPTPPAIDLTAPSFFADPYPVWRWLRDNDPAHLLPNGTLVLTRHADVAAALADARLVNRPSRFSAIGPRHRDRRTSADVAANILPFIDGSEHRERRKALAAAIRSSLAATDAGIRELAHMHADRFVAANGGDMLADFATPYSLDVMVKMFGLAEADHGLAGWCDAFFRLFAPATSREALDETDAALADFRACFLTHLARAHKDDATSILGGLKTLADGGALSMTEAADAAMLIFADGIENVDALVANALIALRDSPEWMARLLADPSLAGDIVEETLRFDTPGQVIARIAAEDCEIAGRKVRAEMPVLLAMGSANRDDAAWRDAGRFDPARRQDPLHLSFGAGRHGCLGARLVRLKATAALTALAQACEKVALTRSPLEWEHRFGHRWVTGLQVSVSPR